VRIIDPHFTLLLQGGLGNQLFQFFAGKYFALQSGIPVKFGVRGLGSQSMHVNSDIRDFKFTSIDEFKYPADVTKCKRIVERGEFYLARKLPKYGAYRRIVTINQVDYSGEIDLNEGDRVIGYFQCNRYHNEYRNIFGEIDWTPSISPKFRHENQSEISFTENAIVHVRGGDFLSTQNSNLNLDRDYYEYALKSLDLAKNAKIFVFTDDFNHADLLLRGIPNMVFVNQKGLRASQVLLLMSTAKNVVVSNSTFSYWSAIASSARVVAPSRWLTNAPEVIHLYPSDWNIISNN